LLLLDYFVFKKIEEYSKISGRVIHFLSLVLCFVSLFCMPKVEVCRNITVEERPPAAPCHAALSFFRGLDVGVY
jgi:hypothetical protein